MMELLVAMLCDPIIVPGGSCIIAAGTHARSLAPMAHREKHTSDSTMKVRPDKWFWCYFDERCQT